MRSWLPVSSVAWLCGLLAASLILAGPACASAVHGALEGKELAIADDVRSGLESMAGSLLGGDLKGQVTRVVVEEDAPRRLTVRLAYEGFQGAKIWGELQNSDRRRQAGIAMGEPSTIADAAGEVVLTFDAGPGVKPTRSALLRISVAAPGRRTPSYTRSFKLGKEWSESAVSGANFAVTITPQAIGRTAELGATPSMTVPASVARTDAVPPPPRRGAGVVPLSTQSQIVTRSILANTAGVASVQDRRTAPAAVPTPVRSTLRETNDHRIKRGLDPADASRGARGPAALPLRPFGDVRTEDINLDLTRVLNVFPEVYQDQEPASGIFYFLPHGYALKWDETAGYGFRTIYSAATAGTAGQVMMAASLDGGIGTRDLEIAAKIVQAYALSRGMKFLELRALPIDTLAISISDDLGRYSIPADRISVQGLSDVTGQLEVSWVTDERTKNFIQEALVENVGIHGSVTYAPTGSVLGPRTVPIRMQLADYATFGPFRWDRTGWKNNTPYPVTLRYLHALRLAPGGPPVVNSWGLHETLVPPGGHVTWSSAGVPFWIDSQAQKMWIDYTVDQTCKSCGRDAITELTGGVSTAGSSQVTFHSLTPLAETGAHDIQVEVRSKFFDPRGEQVQVRSFVVDADEKDFLVGPMFVGDRSAGSVGTLFEFRLSLTMKDGNVVAGNAAWIQGDTMRIPIGRRQLEQSIGALPGH